MQDVEYSKLENTEFPSELKMAVFWNVVPCSLVEIYRRFGGAYCRHHQAVSP
jgi:hypothetical protein